MNRRGFLGALVGAVALSFAPFDEAPHVITDEDFFERYAKPLALAWKKAMADEIDREMCEYIFRTAH